MRWAAASIVGMYLIGGASADFCPPGAPEAGGMRDIMLIYLVPEGWEPEQFRPYVAYLDSETGAARDWFFDAFLFLAMMPTPSGGSYFSGSANLEDWQYYLDLLFKETGYVASLEVCIAEVERELGPPPRAIPVLIMIPYLNREQAEFGDVDGDGRAEDTREEGDRVRCQQWLIDEVIRRWGERPRPSLSLWGFYWMNEGIGTEDEDLVRAIAAYAASKGYGLHWIPWFRAPGFQRWKTLGITFAVMQPNFAFMDVPRGLLVPDEDRLSQNANLCRDLGMGVEMELTYNVARSEADRLNLQLYLNHGVDELDGTMNGAVRAWYQSHDLIAQLCRSDLTACRQLYDDCYRFHKGTYQRRRVSLCEGARCTVNGQVSPQLTDGLWMTRGTEMERLVTAELPAALDLWLDRAEMVGEVRIHLAPSADGDRRPPQAVRVLTSEDGLKYELACELPAPYLQPAGEWQTGFALLSFAPRPARAVRVELLGEGGQSAVDEVVIYPVPHVLMDCRYQVEGLPQLAAQATRGLELCDGRLATSADGAGALPVSEGGARVRFPLPDSYVLDEAMAHAWWPPQAPPPQARVRVGAAQGSVESEWSVAAGEGEGWVKVRLPRSMSQEVVFELSGGEGVAWDELQVMRAPNRALGKPYWLRPAFGVRYPDDNQAELTDGVLTESGFADGRTVGWTSRSANWTGRGLEITLDLGKVYAVEGVRVLSEGGGYAAVHFPVRLRVLVSADGVQWREVSSGPPSKELVFSRVVGQEQHELAWLSRSFPPIEARQIRLRLDPPPDLWCWIMISEVEVFAESRNVATGCPYYYLPAPWSEQKYADDGIRLTDGDIPRAGEGWGKSVGWDTDNPEVIVDLLAVQPVSWVRVHCVGGGDGGVYFPTRLTVATSVDGENWEEAGEAEAAPPESGQENSVAYLDVQMRPRIARFVRIRAERKGWLMLNEIEVYGPDD